MDKAIAIAGLTSLGAAASLTLFFRPDFFKFFNSDFLPRNFNWAKPGYFSYFSKPEDRLEQWPLSYFLRSAQSSSDIPQAVIKTSNSGNSHFTLPLDKSWTGTFNLTESQKQEIESFEKERDCKVKFRESKNGESKSLDELSSSYWRAYYYSFFSQAFSKKKDKCTKSTEVSIYIDTDAKTVYAQYKGKATGNRHQVGS